MSTISDALTTAVRHHQAGRLREAETIYRQILAADPDHYHAWHLLGAIASFRQAVERKPDFAAAYSNLLYTLVFCPGYDARAILEEHRLWSRRYAEPLARPIQPHPNDRSPHRRLRIGYVSPDFRDHAESFFTAPLLSAHDHHHFEIFCYADGARPDGITARLRSFADVWRDIAGLTDEQVARL